MMRGQRSRAALAAAVAATLTLSGCGFTGLYGAPLPGGADVGSHPFTVVAYFDNALDLVPQSSVKVNDVSVGKVTKISLAGWKAKVTVEVNGSVKLPANARAEIAQTSLLGEKYVSLEQPTVKASSARLKSGSVIPISRTRSAAEVEEVLGALSLLLNEGGLRQIKVIGDELNKALGGNEPEVKDLITQLNTFVGTLDSQKTGITTALDHIDALSVTLNRQKQILLNALDTFPQALRVLSGERTKLVKLLTSLDKLGVVATDVINATQTQLVSSLKALNPVLRQLEASGDGFPQSLRIAGTFPFPLGTTRSFVKGDYANLDAYLNLDLSETLCGLNKQLCGSASPLSALSGSSAKSSRISTKSRGATTSAATVSPLRPMIIGAGG